MGIEGQQENNLTSDMWNVVIFLVVVVVGGGEVIFMKFAFYYRFNLNFL